jgi:hypothetical protein
MKYVDRIPGPGKQLLGHARPLALGKPSENYVDSLSNWMDGMKPVVEEESHFLEVREDLTPLSGPDQGNRVLERSWRDTVPVCL